MENSVGNKSKKEMSKMQKENFRGEELLCPIKYCMDIAGGKWKSSILCILADEKPHRNSNIKRKLGNITNTMLTQSLQQLEDAGMITRTQYNEVPPRVEYSLTEDGKSIIPLLVQMGKWGSIQMEKHSEKRSYCKNCLNTK